MEASEIIEVFQHFLEETYSERLLDALRKDQKSLNLAFSELSLFNPDLADLLLDQPDDVLRSFELAVEGMNLEGDLKGFKVRIFGLPDSQHLQIKNIRSKHIGKFIQMDGIIRQKSDVRPQVTAARYECPSCGNILNIIQLEQKFKEPTRCSCGRKGKFRMLDKELVDAQKIVLEESPETLEGSAQAKRLDVFLKNDLVSPLSERKTNPGAKIQITGQIKEVPIMLAHGGQSTRFDLINEVNHIEPIFEDFTEVTISKEDLKKIKETSQDPKIYQKLTSSMAPGIYGHDKVKEALLLQLFGGVKKEREDGVTTRGDMHILLIGDPGSGKSQLLKRIEAVAPKCRYVSGKGASGAGLTATVVKDEFLRGWALEAGALVLANKGLVCIDELDKMSRDDTSSMHEAMEQQSISISKANIQATLRCETTILAAANPKFGRFDPYEILAKQIDLPSTLINRFDLIFPIRDLPSQEKDEALASFILELHKTHELEEAPFKGDFIKKYVAYARQNLSPRLSDEALEEIKRYYVKMRNQGGAEEGAVHAIPISARQLEAMVRLAEASARTRLSKKVSKKDARRAIELTHFCLAQIGVDPETGKIDIDRITTGISASQRSHIVTVKEIINELEKAIGKIIPVEDVVREAKTKGLEEEKVDEVVEKLKRSGDLFQPRPGFISKI
ncbi:AAA family ATPase [Candidatus Woesearchaeota archaeon]|nr:AAA family ATPase [Candidatus Woesearchaeota archaeon]